MTLKHYLERVASLPLRVVVLKILKRGRQVLWRAWARQHIRLSSTYLEIPPRLLGDLCCYFKPIESDKLCSHSTQLVALSQLYLNHTFDLLGSGWTQVKHGIHCRGLENHRYEAQQLVKADKEGRWLEKRVNAANLEEVHRIWGLIDPEYVPIDWQLDFKSGYRWKETTWYQGIAHGHIRGADAKVPWELARLQHSSQLVWAYLLAAQGEPGFDDPHAYLREFRNEVLDFIATNPPGFGVNWKMSMEVAIRAVNWLVTYDLFRAHGASFDTPFEVELKRSIYQHGQHIVSNLEWFFGERGNHYLADVVGLLFVAAYLPCNPEIDAWLAFAVQELVGEVEYQFNPDGSNFEASTSYHRLVTEMLVYGTAMVLALPPQKQAVLKSYDHHLLKTHPALKPGPMQVYPLPEWYFERLERALEFTQNITKPNHHVVQIGDNDSGRFLKLQPAIHPMPVDDARERYLNLDGHGSLADNDVYWDEDILDHRHLIAAGNGLYGLNDFVGTSWLETEIVRSLVGSAVPSRHASGSEEKSVEIGTREDWEHIWQQQLSAAAPQRLVLEIPLSGPNLLDGLILHSYPDFGLYIYRSKRLYLAIRCGSIGQYGIGGHAHNDQLSIELNVDGEDWIADPGTYLYTSLPERRNEYRSAKAHFGPRPAYGEPWRLDAGLFELSGRASAICLCFCAEGFVGRLITPEGNITRSIQITTDKIAVIDTTTSPTMLIAQEQPSLHDKHQPLFSNGYGKRLRG